MSVKEKLINIENAAEMLGVSKDTLRNWDKNGKLKSQRTEGNHRRYRLGDILKILGVYDEMDKQKESVAIYCRVSSHDQKKKGDLDRQKGRILEYCVKKGYTVDHIIEEVRSGMSDTRPKLKTLFKLVRNREINKIVVEHKDRLCRFMFNIFVEFFDSFDVKIECVSQKRTKGFEDELVEDMLALMSSFSAKIYGKRSAANRKKKKLEKEAKKAKEKK